MLLVPTPAQSSWFGQRGACGLGEDLALASWVKVASAHCRSQRCSLLQAQNLNEPVPPLRRAASLSPSVLQRPLIPGLNVFPGTPVHFVLRPVVSMHNGQSAQLQVLSPGSNDEGLQGADRAVDQRRGECAVGCAKLGGRVTRQQRKCAGERGRELARREVGEEGRERLGVFGARGDGAEALACTRIVDS